MNSNLNKSHTEPSNADDQWAKGAVRSMLDICGLNASVVTAGLFPTYIHAMTSDVELLQFKAFLDRMLAGHRAYLKVKP
jgi:hypothetical protein